MLCLCIAYAIRSVTEPPLPALRPNPPFESPPSSPYRTVMSVGDLETAHSPPNPRLPRHNVELALSEAAELEDVKLHKSTEVMFQLQSQLRETDRVRQLVEAKLQVASTGYQIAVQKLAEATSRVRSIELQLFECQEFRDRLLNSVRQQRHALNHLTEVNEDMAEHLSKTKALLKV
jgi:flagellar biosynthesis chaperone FliJ